MRHHLLLSLPSVAAILVGIIGTLPDACGGLITVEKNPKDPFNPMILVESNRPETGYSGPLHLFGASYGMHHVSLKMEMMQGQHQCYYFILTEGYQLTVFAASVSPNENKFHLFLANSDSNFLRKYADQTSVALVHNVTVDDTYEVCMINTMGSRTILFSAVYYQPTRYEAEMRNALSKAAIVTNISDATAKYISGIEVNIGNALNHARYKPNLYRDYLTIRDSNAYVQWKSIIFIFLVFCSFGGTTLFIRYLFHVPKGKVSI